MHSPLRLRRREGQGEVALSTLRSLTLDEVFQFSDGLNGVGTKAVNALSDDAPRSRERERVVADRVRVVREKLKPVRSAQLSWRGIRRGQLQARQSFENEKKGKNPKESDGTYVEFEPDTTIFKETDSKPEHAICLA